MFARIRALYAAAWEAVLLWSSDLGRVDDPHWDSLRAAQADVLADAASCSADQAQPEPRRRDAAYVHREVTRSRADLERAVQRAVEANLRLVVSIAAKRFAHLETPTADRVQAGVLGCLRAVRDFDPTRGLRFSTYATHWIEHAIRREHQDTGTIIRRSVHMHHVQAQVRAAEARISAETGVSASEVEDATIARAIKRKSFVVRRVRSLPVVVASVDATSAVVQGETSADARGPDEEIDAARYASALGEGLSFLPDQVAEVVRSRLCADEPETLAQVGARLGLSRERIRQLQILGVERLRVVIPQIMRRMAAERRSVAS